MLTISSDPSGYTGFRNLLHNGNFMINQREINSLTPATGQQPMSVDRWRYYQTSAATTLPSWSLVSDVPTSASGNGFPLMAKSCKITIGTTWGVSVYSSPTSLFQVLEYEAAAKLCWGTTNALPATLSFWVKSSLTGSHGGYINNIYNGSQSYPFLYTINAANTWEYKTVYIPPPPVSGNWGTPYITSSNLFNSQSISVGFSLTSGRQAAPGVWNTLSAPPVGGATGQIDFSSNAGATWQVYNVQFEKGSVATPFEERFYNTELAICQRFLPSFNASGPSTSTPSANASYIGTTMNASGTYMKVFIPFKVETRAPVTGIEWATTQGLDIYSAGSTPWQAGNITPSLISFDQGGTLGARLSANAFTSGSSSSTVGSSGLVYLSQGSTNYSNKLLFTGAEL